MLVSRLAGGCHRPETARKGENGGVGRQEPAADWVFFVTFFAHYCNHCNVTGTIGSNFDLITIQNHTGTSIWVRGFDRLHSAHTRAGAGALPCGAAGGAGGQEGSGLLFR